MPQPSIVDVVEREFPKAADMLDKWSQHIYENILELGWNVCIERPESAGIRGNTDHSDTIFEEIARLQLKRNRDDMDAVSAHTAWRQLPRQWRRGLWAIYIEKARAAETLSIALWVRPQEVGTHLRGAYADFLDRLPRVVAAKAA